MAATVPTDSWLQYGSKDNHLNSIREDLADVIYDISPTETPFVSAASRGASKGVLHEWQTDELAAVATPAALEGADPDNVALVETVRLNNINQIQEKTLQISGTNMVQDNAGYASEQAYQIAKKGLEMKRDMEYTLLRGAAAEGQAKTAGDSGTARTLGNIKSWISTNAVGGAGASECTGDGSDVRTAGADQAFTEDLLTDRIDAIWNEGGNPNMVLSGSYQKRIMNDFVGRADPVRVSNGAARLSSSSGDKKIMNAVDVYVSDYGELMLVPNRFMGQDDVFILETGMWSVDYLRDFQTNELAKTGDSLRTQMLVEYTLRSNNEKASGAIYDLATA